MVRIASLACALVLAVVITVSPGLGHGPVKVAASDGLKLSPALREPAKVIDMFHAALAAGETARAAAQLANDALIFESGSVERGKAEYSAHHLAADAAFAQAVPSVTGTRTGQVVGDIAWITSEGRTKGSYKGKAVNSVSTETMVLRRMHGVWKIVHVHWSSRTPKS